MASLPAAWPGPLLHGHGEEWAPQAGPGSYPAREEECLHFTLPGPAQGRSALGEWYRRQSQVSKARAGGG